MIKFIIHFSLDIFDDFWYTYYSISELLFRRCYSIHWSQTRKVKNERFGKHRFSTLSQKQKPC